MSNVSKNLSMVKEKMRNAYLKRPVEQQNREPRLVAVTKTKPKELIIEAYKCGQRHFGENYVDEILDKGFDDELLNACPDIKWHFIGHLQRNKVNKLLSVPNLYIIESVDTLKLAEAINARLEKIQEYSEKKLNIFVQVNTSGEEAKSGCHPDETTDLVKQTIENCKKLNVLGLMTIGKYDNYNPVEAINPDFQTLVNCRKKVCEDLNIDINNFELSMGMSADYEHAIELGATNVRVGTMIFGERAMSKLQKHLAMYGELKTEELKKPYQILIDGTICVAALKNKINIQEQFPKYLEGEVKLLTTQCIVKEVEKLGPATFGALLIIKKFGIHQCGHAKSPVPASECISSMIGESNSSRYIIASQDRELQQKCRKIQGVPLLYLHSRTPVLEPPSLFSQDKASEKTLETFTVNDFDREKLALLNKDENDGGETRRKRKRKGGPNPLSCKKKKRKPEENVTTSTKTGNPKKKKRKRNRSRLVKKIKNEIKESLNC